MYTPRLNTRCEIYADLVNRNIIQQTSSSFAIEESSHGLFGSYSDNPKLSILLITLLATVQALTRVHVILLLVATIRVSLA